MVLQKEEHDVLEHDLTVKDSPMLPRLHYMRGMATGSHSWRCPPLRINRW